MLIRELYCLSEAGAFDSVDLATAQTTTDFLMTLMNPKISYKQAEKMALSCYRKALEMLKDVDSEHYIERYFYHYLYFA